MNAKPSRKKASKLTQRIQHHISRMEQKLINSGEKKEHLKENSGTNLVEIMVFYKYGFVASPPLTTLHNAPNMMSQLVLHD